MTSILSAFPFIGEQSFATPGAFNSPLSTISANIAAINADVGAISGVTISPPSGNTIQMPSDLSISGYLSVGKGVSIGTQAPSIAEPVALTIGVNSGISDYIYFNDTANLRSDYLLGSHVGGTADGLNIFDVSGNTMIVSFSKQSVRFYQNVVGPVFDVGGALASTLNAATFGTGADSKESRIQAGIDAAALGGFARVYVPSNLLPYSASSISFKNNVRMVREGGDQSVWDVLAYGAAGNGTTDDTAACQQAFYAWLASATTVSNKGDRLVFPPAVYKTTQSISSRIGVVTTGTKIISGYGASLQPSLSTGYALEVVIGASPANCRNLTVEGLMIDGPGATDVATGMLHLSSGTLSGFLTRTVLREVTIEHFMGHGITLDGGQTIDQSLLLACHIEADSANTNGFALNAANVAAAEIHGGTYSQGKNNVYVTTSGVRFYGGKYLSAQQEAIVITSGLDAMLFGCNAENSWLGGATAPFWGDTQAAIFVTGRLFAYGCYLSSNNPVKNKYVIRLATSGDQEGCIIGGADFQATSQYYLRAETGGTSRVFTAAIGSSASGAVINANNVTTIESYANRGTKNVMPLYLSADRGDSTITIQPLVDYECQVFNTPLTSTRTVNLLNGYTGSRFHIVRGPGSTGTYPLVVSSITGGNQTLSAASQDLTVGHDGTAFNVTGYGNLIPFGDGTSTRPSINFASEQSLGFYRSGGSTIATSAGTFATSLYSALGGSGGVVDFRVDPNGAMRMAGSATNQDYYLDLGRLHVRDGNGGAGNGAVLTNDGTATLPTFTFNSDASLGLYRSGVSTLALSYGTLNLATQAVRLSMRTLAASSVTASAANTNVATNEVVFTIGGASGASLCISSGGTTYIFSSALSAKNT